MILFYFHNLMHHFSLNIRLTLEWKKRHIWAPRHCPETHSWMYFAARWSRKGNFLAMSSWVWLCGTMSRCWSVPGLLPGQSANITHRSFIVSGCLCICDFCIFFMVGVIHLPTFIFKWWKCLYHDLSCNWVSMYNLSCYHRTYQIVFKMC